jgi:uncharacterized protein (DUF433 family)
MRRETKSSIDEYPGSQIFRNFRELNKSLRGPYGTGRGRHGVDQLVQIIEKPVNRKVVKGHFRSLAGRLCSEHPAISTDADVLGGAPHVINTRLTVGTLLGKLYVYGSVQAVVNAYQPHLSEEQVKEAIAYAQDFLETACDEQETP